MNYALIARRPLRILAADDIRLPRGQNIRYENTDAMKTRLAGNPVARDFSQEHGARQIVGAPAMTLACFRDSQGPTMMPVLQKRQGSDPGQKIVQNTTREDHARMAPGASAGMTAGSTPAR